MIDQDRLAEAVRVFGDQWQKTSWIVAQLTKSILEANDAWRAAHTPAVVDADGGCSGYGWGMSRPLCHELSAAYAALDFFDTIYKDWRTRYGMKQHIPVIDRAIAAKED